MIAGGAEELCATEAAVFDTLFATSVRNDAPHTTPRPFDRARDGLVIGEGAGCLILEEREHALARGATVYAEIVGFGTNSDGCHVTQPNAATMRGAMELALADAGLAPGAIGYVNAHGTGTPHNDAAETLAVKRVFGARAPSVPVSSIKSMVGHTLGAAGAIEAAASVLSLARGFIPPTVHLRTPDPAFGLDYVPGAARELAVDALLSNSFAFGGNNTVLALVRA
jgi:3-oxoacyl-[acyl-carrier-protein] synthase II